MACIGDAFDDYVIHDFLNNFHDYFAKSCIDSYVDSLVNYFIDDLSVNLSHTF